MMKTIIVDKIASVTQACALSHELRVAGEIPCEEGIVLAVEILTSKSQYNTLELTSGRMASVSRGDVVVGALGHRTAFRVVSHRPDRQFNHVYGLDLTVPGQAVKVDLVDAWRPLGRTAPLETRAMEIAT